MQLGAEIKRLNSEIGHGSDQGVLMATLSGSNAKAVKRWEAGSVTPERGETFGDRRCQTPATPLDNFSFQCVNRECSGCR